MSQESTVSPDTLKFARFFKSLDKKDLIPWTDLDYVGISIIKDYPNNIKFIPAVNGKGENDSVALIKIGYSIKHISDNKVILTVSIHKVSKYSFGRFGYDFTDPESPTEQSLEASKKSKQPIDLEDLSRYEFEIARGKFYDNKIKRNVEPQKIVEDIYSEHLKTLGNIKLRWGMFMKAKVIEAIDPSLTMLNKINYGLFGKRIKKSENYWEGILEAYSHKNLIDITLESEKIRILSSDFPISYQAARSFILCTTGLFLTNYYFHYDILGLVALANESAKNPLFLTTITAASLLLIDRGLPHLILTVMNMLIRFKFYLLTLKVHA